MPRHVEINSSQQIPLIFEVDVLVVGGRLAGVVAAQAAAAGGLKVALVESETYLGYEFGAWQRPWIQWRAARGELLRAWLPVGDVADSCADGDHVPLHMDRAKVQLEDRLLEQDVRILYASRPVDYRREGDHWLVVLGNKSGRQAVRTRFVVDASEQGVMSHVAGQEPPVSTTTIVRRTVEFTGVPREGVEHYTLPRELNVAGDAVTVYPGAFSDDHVHVDIPVAVEEAGTRSPESDREVELRCRAISLQVAEHLVQLVPSYREAKLGLGSLRVMREMAFDAAEALARGDELGKALASGDLSADVCYEAGGRDWKQLSLPTAPRQLAGGSAGVARLSDTSAFATSWPGKTVAVTTQALPVLSETDVLVVGGGTSGAPAAYTAARENVSVALVEMNSRLGGTGTVGGIKAHWMSTFNAFNAEIDRRVQGREKRVGYPDGRFGWRRVNSEGDEYEWGEDDSWSIELKEQVLEEMCQETGVALYFDSFVTGALVDGHKVVGAVLATPYGLRVALGTVTVDATGDGDIAAFAGADYTYGNVRDRQTMFSSLALYREPGGLGNNFMTAADMEDILDYTRFIITSRRRRMRDREHVHDCGTYVAPRESRHIEGETTVSLEDQLLLKRYPDTVAVLFSNWDMKGQWFADIVDFGINPPHEDIDIPLRALIPLKLEQIIVAGKAFSLTHDACAAPRMQRDLILLGGAVGLSAAFAIQDDVSPRRLDVAKLQRRLVETGNIPERVLAYAPSIPPDLRGLVEGLAGDEPLEWQEMLSRERATSVSPVIQLCLATSAEVVPLLRETLAKSDGRRRLLLARLLLFHRCPDGANVVFEEVQREFSACDGLPRRVGDIDWSTGSPEQAIEPEVIFLINNLVRVEDRRILIAMGAIVDRLERADRDYRDIRAGIYDYVRTVAVAAERLTWPEFIPLLERLHQLPEVRDSVFPGDYETDYFRERRAFLVLYLARGLARCGSKQGLLQLAGLLADPRAILAGSAHEELRALTEMHHPKDAETWREALRSWPESLAPIPWRIECA
jgi:flavin-dependent dehydrogenase